MRNQCTEMQDHLGKQMIDIVGDQVLQKNLHIQMELSPKNKKGKSVLLVAGDTIRWDKRGGDRKKDSLSGCSVIHANFSKLTTIGFQPMLQTFMKCSKGVEHDPKICPQNYVVGSSKCIEAASVARITSHLFETGRVIIGEHVGDKNDLSCWMVMQCSF
jgi:hypothetical protein